MYVFSEYEQPFFKKNEINSSSYCLTLCHIEMPFNTFANRADPDQAALVRAA